MKKYLSYLVVAVLFSFSTGIVAQTRPNIIFILADDMGYGEIEPFGQRLIKTPNLARMANEGMRLTNHYAGTAVCAPSRCALMTGLHTGHAEVRGNQQYKTRNGQLPMSDQTVTVAELLKAAGYTTGLIGKWGLGDMGTTGDPNKQGFDFFYGYTDQVLAHNHFPQFLIRNGAKEYLRNEVAYLDSSSWGSITKTRKDFADELFMKEALRFITENQRRNFFLYLPFIIPHCNDEGLKNFQYEAPSQREYASQPWSKDEKDYAASISYLDEYVGKILDHLKKLRLDSNTLVIFTSDNGPRVNQMRFKSSGNFRGFKRDLYEGGIRVPFIAWWPGHIKNNKVSDHVSTFWDFMPTACALAGVERPFTDGISYLPTLLAKGNQVKHDYVYFEFHEGDGAQAVRKGKWKAVVNGVKKANPSALELYDLESDPGEKNNVANLFPEVLAEMSAIIGKAHVPSKVFAISADAN
ncbi:MAG TPA: arylsulfatase [Chryseolinea sp.]|nr:arylsulfatase [Chryseolinea sp.]